MPENEESENYDKEYNKEYKEFEENFLELKKEVEKLKILNDKSQGAFIVNGFSENGR